MPSNLSFCIKSVDSVHLAFKGSASYWESYRADEGDRLTERFEFKQGWQTVYARYIETPLVKVTLSDGYVGWGEANTGVGPEVVCLIVNELLAGEVHAHFQELDVRIAVKARHHLVDEGEVKDGGGRLRSREHGEEEKR
ncbi:MAG: hypothetical protein IIC73_03845 [Armatimonadetes bacterium]|nr:hypothetical protein [Armatimonadota bacterium]